MLQRPGAMPDVPEAPTPHIVALEELDLLELRDLLRGHQDELGGDLDGLTRMRDLVAEHLGCSMLQAEELVDTLVARGFARLERDPEGRDGWLLTGE